MVPTPPQPPLLKSMPISGSMVSGIPLGKQAIHPPSTIKTQAQSDKSEGETSEARKRRKEKIKVKIEKKAEKLMRKRLMEESNKHPFFELQKVPHNYAQSQHPTSQFQSVHLEKPLFFDKMDYPKWSYDMKMHLYKLQPLFGKLLL
jgi:hypothetical protein